jgi:acyl-CoA reductase-like NAD-dependent aldehyde dehydrogenase
VGWDLKARAGKKKVVLELGGNAACVVDLSADIPDAVDRTIFGAFYQSGQSCISVQRILVHEQIYATFRDRLVEAARGLKMGDPKAEETFIGPMISEAEARVDPRSPPTRRATPVLREPLRVDARTDPARAGAGERADLR